LDPSFAILRDPIPRPRPDRVPPPFLAQAAIASSAELELGNVMQLDVAERGIVAAFFEMLKDKSWAHASSADGTDVFKLPGERIHRIMGITRTDATPEQVLTFFSDPHNFDEHFKILDDMFKSGSVVKIGGAREAAALAALAASESEKMLLKKNNDESQPPRDRSGNFPALGLGFGVGKKTVGSDRFGNDQGSHLATDDLGFFQGLGKRIDDAFAKTAGREKRLNDQAAVFAAGLGTKKNEESPSSLAALDALPDATTDATRDALMSDALSATYSSHDASSSGSPFDESFAFGAGASESAADFSKTLAALPIDQNFVDRPGHALLHGTFRLPSLVPDRDFIWDQVAMRLPTGKYFPFTTFY
jgi:hypothetical protein